MKDDKKTTTIELTVADEQFIRALSQRTGIITIIGVLRYALRSAVSHDPAAVAVYDALTNPGVSAMEIGQGDVEL